MENLGGLNSLGGVELWVAMISVAVGVFKAFKFVQEGELGIKLRFGRALRNRDNHPRVINPGFVFLIPFIETLKRHHVRQQTLKLDNQKLMIEQGLIFNVSAIVIFRVRDIYRALFEIDDLDSSLVDLSMGILREVLSEKKHTELSNVELISSELLLRLQEKAEEWGVIFIQFKLTDCAPMPETASLINAEIGVQLKVGALQNIARELEIEFSELSPTLAAALIGAPLVTTVSALEHNSSPKTKTRKKRSKSSLVSVIFGGDPSDKEEEE